MRGEQITYFDVRFETLARGLLASSSLHGRCSRRPSSCSRTPAGCFPGPRTRLEVASEYVPTGLEAFLTKIFLMAAATRRRVVRTRDFGFLPLCGSNRVCDSDLSGESLGPTGEFAAVGGSM